VEHPDYPGERLVVCRNPLLTEERRRKREELMQATEGLLEKIKKSVKSGRLKDRAKIGLRAGKVIGRYKVGKLFKLRIGEGSFSFKRCPERIEKEAELDGFYVIRTSVPKSKLKATAAVAAYKDLSKVERAFRSIKTMDLLVRPVYHWTPNRVRAHIFICMLAYYVEWHMRQALAPVLFMDEELNERPRSSPVAPAERSESAKWKDETKRTLDCRPAHSFQTLLRDLGTITRNTVCASPNEKNSTFQLVTEPSPDQRHVFKLLGVPLKT
jgi:transposase